MAKQKKTKINENRAHVHWQVIESWNYTLQKIKVKLKYCIILFIDWYGGGTGASLYIFSKDFIYACMFENRPITGQLCSKSCVVVALWKVEYLLENRKDN